MAFYEAREFDLFQEYVDYAMKSSRPRKLLKLAKAAKRRQGVGYLYGPLVAYYLFCLLASAATVAMLR